MHLVFVSTGTSISNYTVALFGRGTDGPFMKVDGFVPYRWQSWTDDPLRGREFGEKHRDFVVHEVLRRRDEDERVSAEVATIDSLVKAGTFGDDDVKLVLFGAELPQNEVCLDWNRAALEACLPSDIFQIENAGCVPGLQMGDSQELQRTGLLNLAQLALGRMRAEEPGTQSHFLVTGGFKGVIPFLTLLALISRSAIHYLFDLSEGPITIPPLRVSLQRDQAVSDEFRSVFELLIEAQHRRGGDVHGRIG